MQPDSVMALSSAASYILLTGPGAGHSEGTLPMRYTVVLEQEDDGGFSASVPALPGCHSQGDTRGEAMANVREAIELYVETLRDAGEPIPTEAGKEFVEIEAG
jgi:predicted RNase H-like HicB family nuclease